MNILFQNFKECVTTKFADFGGRARRREYWLYALAELIISAFIQGLSSAFTRAHMAVPTAIVSAISIIVSVLLFIPGLAVAVRRLHDTGHSAWWILLGPFAAIVGSIALFSSIFDTMSVGLWILLILACIAPFILIYFYVKPGDAFENDYGPDPKADENQKTNENDATLPQA